MLSKLSRYARAFVTAVRLTLNGKTIEPAESRYPKLAQWVATGLERVDAVYRIADEQGYDSQKRQTITLTLDRRPMNMDVILGAVRHNLTMEYPRLMERVIDGNITAIYALNMNDQYRVGQLAEYDDLPPPLREAIIALRDHLQDPPPSNDLGA